ncbi:MAG: YggS family pyridoxal phosphate-dependent enzyme [Spirochaetia bacterium]|jgi:hypothetical protein|nr:YggS family pyridoxal phosphate-dependent enzyme [Spirochaetia bacterium]
MTDYGSAGERITAIREKIAAAAQHSGRKAETVKIMAVTKFHPAAAVRAAYKAGIRLFGENRVQEAEGKYSEALRSELPGIELDMIGNLQSNKINKALALFDGIQSVSSLGLLQTIASKAKPIRLYLELHTAEDSKSGFSDERELFSAVEAYARIMEDQKGAAGIRLAGLMTMAPFTGEEASIRASFCELRRVFEAVRQRFALPGFEELSMGMSGDYEIAVEEGSTLVRIGTAIFGERQ